MVVAKAAAWRSSPLATTMSVTENLVRSNTDAMAVLWVCRADPGGGPDTIMPLVPSVMRTFGVFGRAGRCVWFPAGAAFMPSRRIPDRAVLCRGRGFPIALHHDRRCGDDRSRGVEEQGRVGEHRPVRRDGRYGGALRVAVAAGFVVAAGCAALLMVGLGRGADSSGTAGDAGCGKLCAAAGPATT